MKRVLNPEESKKTALEAITELAGAVKQTLGPGGNPIIIQREGQNTDGTPKYPMVTKDGVTVAESIQFRDPAKNTIAQSVLQVAKNTVNEAGDGTTTAVILSEALFKAGYKYIKQGANGIQLYNELKTMKDEILEHIDSIKQDITIDAARDVAMISSNGDEEIADIVVKAIEAVGEDGHIALEDGYSRTTVLDTVEGAVYKQGWRDFGPHGSLLVTDKATGTVELENPAILLYAGKIQDVHELADVINRIMDFDPNSGQLTNIVPILIVAHDFSDEVKNFIVQNKVQAKLPIAAIKTPFDGSPNARTEILEDLAVLTGGSVSARGILELKDIDPEEHLGSAGRIKVSSKETVFFEGAGDEEEVLSRVSDLKTLLETQMHDFDKDNLRIRIGKLTGGIAIIRVGGDSELEMLEKKDRIEDALCATRVAISDGVVEGGGFVLYSYALDYIQDPKTTGELILKEALAAPIRQLITNVGENPDAILATLPTGLGYDARKKCFSNLLETGIIDPVKVVKSSLENAISIAGLLLTTGGAVIKDEVSQDGMPNPLASMMGMS
jgi:chaperonin GroEL